MIFCGLFAPFLQAICCQEPRDTFDFLDVRSCGTVSLREAST